MGVALLGIVSIAVQAGREAAVEAPSPDDVRRIVAAVVEAAEQNAAAGEGSRREGDRLTEFYVRRAAAVADREHVPPRAMLLALGVALDDTELLRNHPVARFYLAQLESDEERQRRLRVLGRPTLYGRRDWLQHFAVSAALAALAGEETSELIGIRKEIDDARGGSGFSFADLQADYAGIALATAVLGDEAGEDRQDARLALGDLAEGFRVENFVPPLDGLEEGVSWRRFVEEYGGAEGERFQDVCEELRARARGVPGLSPIKFCRRFKGIAGCSFSTARRARGPRLHGFTGGACVVTRDSTVQDAQRVAGAKRSVPRPGCRPAWGVAQCRSRARRAGRCKAKRLIAPQWPIRRGTASLCPGHPGRRRPRGPFCTRPLQAVLRSRIAG